MLWILFWHDHLPCKTETVVADSLAMEINEYYLLWRRSLLHVLVLMLPMSSILTLFVRAVGLSTKNVPNSMSLTKLP